MQTQKEENNYIRLELPRLGKNDFAILTKQLKENGAKYDPEKKGWYVKADQAEKFKELVPSADKGKLIYKGYAYVKKNMDPRIEYGQTEEEILEKLRKWNQEHPDEQYRYCNIRKQGTQQNYVSYDLIREKVVTKVYLDLPPVNKAYFDEIKEYLKGLDPKAGFDWEKKQWYVQQDQVGQVNNFLDTYRKLAAPEEKQSKAEQQDHNHDIPNEELSRAELMLENVKIQYEIEMVDGSKLMIESSEFERMTGVKTFFEKDSMEVIDAIGMVAARNARIIGEPEYNAIINQNTNTCRVIRFHNGEQSSLDIPGAQYCINYQNLSNDEVKGIIKQHLEALDKRSMKEGEKITVYHAVSGKASNGFPITAGVEKVQGTFLQNVTYEEYPGKTFCRIQEDNGKILDLNEQKVFKERQGEFLEQIKGNISQEAFDMIADRKLSVPQMKEIYYGIKEEIPLNLVAVYADPKIRPDEMNIYRYGMSQGISCRDIQAILAVGKEMNKSWEENRQTIEDISRIRNRAVMTELERHGFQVDDSIMKKIVRLNQLTQKENSLQDICSAFKEGRYAENSPAGKVVRELGSIFQKQENMRLQAAAMTPEQ